MVCNTKNVEEKLVKIIQSKSKVWDNQLMSDVFCVENGL